MMFGLKTADATAKGLSVAVRKTEEFAILFGTVWSLVQFESDCLLTRLSLKPNRMLQSASGKSIAPGNMCPNACAVACVQQF